MPTDWKLVPGNFDFKGFPGNPLLEAHGQISFAEFYYDPKHEPNGGTIKGAYVAYGQYASCDYYGPNDASCSLGAVWFIDCVDPKVRNEVAFGNTKDANGEWIPEYWYFVGKGSFTLYFAPGS